MTDYPISTTVTLYYVVRDEAGEQVDPGDIMLRVEDPSHTVTEPEVVPVSGATQLAAAAAALGQELTSDTGVFQALVTPDAAGTWFVHWQATTPTTGLYDWFQVPWPLIEMEAS